MAIKVWSLFEKFKLSELNANFAELDKRTSKTNNPHSVTKTQVGLGNVDNTSDATKNVLTSTKLATARTINLTGDVTGSVSTDFSTNPSITTTSRKIAFVGSGLANSNGWYKVAEQTMSGYGNTNITFMVTSTYSSYPYQYGILELQMRSENTSISCQTFDWMTKKGFVDSDFIIVINGTKWSMYVYRKSLRYGRICFEILSMSNERSKNMDWNLTFEDNLIKETIIPTPTVISTENSIVGYSNKLTTARTISLTGDVTGSVSFDGSADVSITSTISSHYNGVAHNTLYRGEYLGTSVTAEQYAAISAGTFEDLYIGDYWTIDGRNYRIAAFDYYWNCGDTSFNTHHAVIVPEKNLYNAKMNTTDTTTGGYVGSQMYTTNLEQAKTTIKGAFSGHVVNHRIYLVNAVTNGYASGGKWVDSEVDLMNEQMVYGSGIFSHVSTGSAVPYNHRVEKNQLPLFAMNPGMLNTRENYWLRDVVTDTNFALVLSDGRASHAGASYSLGVRPAFCIS